LSNLFQNRNPLRESLQVFFNAHDHGLRFAASVHHKALFVLPHALQDLTKLCACRERWYNAQDRSGFCCFRTPHNPSSACE